MPTIRQQMIDLLSQGEYGAKELSQMLGIREKEVYEHLPHVSRSVASLKHQLKVVPSRCLICGRVFSNRKRFNKPSRCYNCKSERITETRYQVI